MMKSASGDANSVASSFISPTAASQHRFQAQQGSTVLAALEKPSNQIHVDFDEFYSERVSNFEHERGIFSHYFRLIEPKRDDTYNLEWENRKLMEETRLSQLEFDQLEEKIHKILKDVELMKKEVADEQNSQSVRKQQIRRLEELARPVERDVTYLIPDRFSQYREREQRKLGKFGEADKHSLSLSSSQHSSKQQQKQKNASNAATILDPTKSVKTGEVLQLESRLHDETLRVTSLLQDVHAQIRHAIENRHISTLQFAETHRADLERARSLWQENDAVDFQCFYAVAELLKLRFRIMIAQREEIEALETLQRDRDDFKEREESLKHEILEEMERSHRSVQQELEDSMREFQQQMVALDTQIDDLQRKKYELETAHSKMSQKEEQIAADVAIWEARYEKLRRRHALDMEGYRREMEMLEKKLLQLEKQEKKRLQRQRQEIEEEKLIAAELQQKQQQQQQHSHNEEEVEDEYNLLQRMQRQHALDKENWHNLAEELAQLHFHSDIYRQKLSPAQEKRILIKKKKPLAAGNNNSNNNYSKNNNNVQKQKK